MEVSPGDTITITVTSNEPLKEDPKLIIKDSKGAEIPTPSPTKSDNTYTYKLVIPKWVSPGDAKITVEGCDIAGNKGSATADVAISARSWDVNQDGKVDIFDLVIVSQHFGESPPKDPKADLNGDGSVNIFDLVLVGQHFGERYIPAAPEIPS